MPTTPTRFSILGVTLSVLAIVASSYLAEPVTEVPALKVTKEMTTDMEAKVMQMGAGEAVIVEFEMPDPLSC
jgi:electron transfer flavoprotein alpha/beta subunit